MRSCIWRRPSKNWERIRCRRNPARSCCAISSNSQRSKDDEIAKWMRALEQPERADLAVKHLSDESPMWNSMLRDTIAPTMLQAGVRVNVVPSEATANLNIRMLPGHSIEELMGQFDKDRQRSANSISAGARFRRKRPAFRPDHSLVSRPSSASRRRNFPARSPCRFFAPAPRTRQACACIRCRRTGSSHFQ